MTLRDGLAAVAPLLAIVGLVFGPATAWLAARQHRNPALWLLFGATLGPLAMLLLELSPPARCPGCGEPTQGFSSDCWVCGIDTRAPATPRPMLGGNPALSPGGQLARRGTAFGSSGTEPLVGHVVQDQDPGQDQGSRLMALGARRPVLPATRSGALSAIQPAESRHDLTMLAIGVFVSGSEQLVPGSRYLIARTADRLVIIGPVESSPEHVEIDLPIVGVEANFIPGSLAISGWRNGRSGRRFVLIFHAISSLTAGPIDEALMERHDPFAGAVGS